MAKLILSSFLWISILIHPILSEFIYTAVTPSSIRPRSTFSIITTLEKSESPVTFKFEISSEKNETIISQEVTLPSDGLKVVDLQIGDLLDEAYNLTVKATSKEKSSEDRIILERDLKNTSILIQSDKPIYKPGETVRFRVLILNRFFQPFKSDKIINVTVSDSENNIIKTLKSTIVPAGRGFISDNFDLSVELNLGTWVITVELDDDRESQTYTFAVDQYVLPKFKVDLTLSPTFASFNDTKFMAEVTSTYSYGKPVKAKCTLNLEENGVYGAAKDRITSVTKTIQLEEGVGNAYVDFDIKKELTLKADEVSTWGKSYTLSASCKDDISGAVKNQSADLSVYKYPYKLSVVDRPDNIKPGFPVNITIKVSTQDDLPIGDSRADALTIEHGFDSSEEGGIYRTSIPSTGIVLVPFVALKNPKVCYESLEVTYKDLKESFWLPGKTVSSTGSYMQLTLKTENPKENEEVVVHVKTSKPFKSLNAVLIARGVVIKSELIKSGGQKDQDISVTLPPNSSPKSTLVIYSVFLNDNVIIDTLKLNVQPSKKNDLNITLSDMSVEPGTNVSISVKGFPNSIIGLRAVDQSVLLLAKDNDITNDKLSSVADQFESSTSSYWGGSDMFQIFTRSGLNILTNAVIEKGNPQWAPVYEAAEEAFYSTPVSLAFDTDRIDSQGLRPTTRAPTRKNKVSSGGGGGGSVPVRVRSFFPETWIWEELDSPEGQITIHKPVPDTITSWAISGFQINQNEGLGLAMSPPKLTVFRPFFISLNLPYSVVKGEVLGLQVLVHNYMEKPVSAKVTLENKDSFFKFLEAGNSVNQMVKEVNVNASSITSVTFPLTPLKFGIMTLNVKAITNDAGDAVSQPLIVKPPGIKHIQNSAILLNLLSGKSAQENVTAVFPEQRVPEADFLKVSVLGDILGGTMSNLDKLIRLPRGCGEQNMINFVPDIVILDYLNTTGGLTPEIKRKATNFLEKGYQQQLTYMRYDGSYSVFGKSDQVGSTWLTAFVTRAFIQARKYITIDDDVIDRSLRFLVGQQNDNGSFAEEGYVYDKSLQGGSGATQYALTAFTLLTFAEAQKSEINLTQFSNESIIDKGVEYLLNGTSKGQLNTSPYGVNLITYLLHFINHPKKDDYFKMIEDLATIDLGNNTKYWKPFLRQKPSVNQSMLKYRPYERSATPATIEITSYGLLTYLLRGEDKVSDSVSIVKWLMKQRNAEGGFISTQDTVLGITALAKFAEAIGGKDTVDAEMNVKVSYNTADGVLNHDFYIGKDNKTTLQEFFLPLNVREVDLLSSGKGTALAQLTWTYYVEATDSSPAFDLKVDVKDRDKGRILDMKVCTSYIRGEDGKESNMAILEANAPSGYAFDAEELETLRETQIFKRYELDEKDSKVNLYFNSVNASTVCLNLQAYRIYLVAKHSKGVAKIYDYYDNTQKAQYLYNVPAISLCDICSADKSCEIKDCALPASSQKN